MFITIDDACEKYETNRNTILSRKLAIQSAKGIAPDWYKVHNKRAYIHTNGYERMGVLERKAWLYATEKLWFIFEDLGININELSILMSNKSDKCYTTWKGFFYNKLFLIPPEIVSGIEKSMRVEFVQHGTRIIYDMIKEGKIKCVNHNQI